MNEAEKKLTFNNISFDKDNKTFTITKGSTGEYSFYDVKKVEILYEDAKYTNKTLPFTHCVLLSPLHFQIIQAHKVFVGLGITLKDASKVYVYVSENSTLMQNDMFNADVKQAEKIKALFNKIITKYTQ